MVGRDELLRFLDQTLKPDAFKDGCPNGLQVYGREQIEKLATCVSVSREFFELAGKARADTLLVHHGLFWDRDTRVIHPHMGERLKLLLDNQTNLLAFHLPLDAHRELGNNARLADLLELGDRDWEFGHYHGTPIGVAGSLPEPLPLQDVADKLQRELGGSPQVFDFGPDRIRRVGVVSGGAGDIPMMQECGQSGCDAFLTGNIFEQTVAVARELGLGAIAAGHYNTEKLGVRALGDLIAERLDVQVIHLDVPNPV